MKFPIEMYRIREEDVKIKVPCEHCADKGIVDKHCNRCGGNGTHNKTIGVWKIMPRTVTVEKIDRETENRYYRGKQHGYVGELRYWTCACEFFRESEKLIHFNKKDAQEECDRRNVDIEDILKIHNSNNQSNKINMVYDNGMIFVNGDRQNGIALSNKGMHLFINGVETLVY